MRLFRKVGSLLILIIFALSLTVLARSLYFNQIKPKYTYGMEYKQIEEKYFLEDFELKTTLGDSVRLSDFRGEVVFLTFWSMDNKHSSEMLLTLDEFDIELANNNHGFIFAINYMDEKEVIDDFLLSNELFLPVLLDTDGELTNKYVITKTPTTLIINPNGSLYNVIIGVTNQTTLSSIARRINENK